MPSETNRIHFVSLQGNSNSTVYVGYISSKRKRGMGHHTPTFLILRLMIDSAANTLSPTADSSMFTPVLPTVSLLTLARQIFFSSPSHSEFPTDHNTPEQNGRQRNFFTVLPGNRSRWNLYWNAHWSGRCYVLGLLSEGRSVRQCEFFQWGNVSLFPALRVGSLISRRLWSSKTHSYQNQSSYKYACPRYDSVVTQKEKREMNKMPFFLFERRKNRALKCPSLSVGPTSDVSFGKYSSIQLGRGLLGLLICDLTIILLLRNKFDGLCFIVLRI